MLFDDESAGRVPRLSGGATGRPEESWGFVKYQTINLLNRPLLTRIRGQNWRRGVRGPLRGRGAAPSRSARVALRCPARCPGVPATLPTARPVSRHAVRAGCGCEAIPAGLGCPGALVPACRPGNRPEKKCPTCDIFESRPYIPFTIGEYGIVGMPC